MKTQTTFAAVAALAAASMAIAAPAFASEFASINQISLSYTGATVTGHPKVTTEPTFSGVYSGELELTPGTPAYNALMGTSAYSSATQEVNLAVTITVNATTVNPFLANPNALGVSTSDLYLNTANTVTNTNGIPSIVSVTNYTQVLSDTNVTIDYSGAPIIVGTTPYLTPGTLLLGLSDATSVISGQVGAAGVNFNFIDTYNPASASGDFASQFFIFTPNGEQVTADSFTFSDSSLTGVISGASNSKYAYLKTLTYLGNGNFSSTPVPGAPPLPGVPEPASWALMLLGVGAVGGMMRRKAASRLA